MHGGETPPTAGRASSRQGGAPGGAPGGAAGRARAGPAPGRRKMLLDVAPNGHSYILAVNEYCQRQFQTDVLYVYGSRGQRGYSATAIIDGLTYATEVSANKFVARIMAARSTAEVLLPESRCGQRDARLPAALNLAVFDNVDLADERIPEITVSQDAVKPYRLLLRCLDRNFGYSERDIEFMTFAGTPFSGGRLTMTVGTYSVSVPMSRFAKQEASQSILVNVHPHLESWGSLIRMYLVNEADDFSRLALYLERAQDRELNAEPELQGDVVAEGDAGEDMGTDHDEEGEDDEDSDSDEEVPVSILYGDEYRDDFDDLEAMAAREAAAAALREVNYCEAPTLSRAEHGLAAEPLDTGHVNPAFTCCADADPWGGVLEGCTSSATAAPPPAAIPWGALAVPPQPPPPPPPPPQEPAAWSPARADAAPAGPQPSAACRLELLRFLADVRLGLSAPSHPEPPPATRDSPRPLLPQLEDGGDDDDILLRLIEHLALK